MISFTLPGFSAKAPPVPPPPPIKEPAVMPDPDDVAGKIKQRRQVAMRQQQSGRLSTMNVPPAGTLLS